MPPSLFSNKIEQDADQGRDSSLRPLWPSHIICPYTDRKVCKPHFALVENVPVCTVNRNIFLVDLYSNISKKYNFCLANLQTSLVFKKLLRPILKNINFKQRKNKKQSVHHFVLHIFFLECSFFSKEFPFKPFFFLIRGPSLGTHSVSKSDV